MHLRVNLQARLERHARNLNAQNKRRIENIFRKFKVLSTLLVVLLPIYPSLASLAAGGGSANNYDESSILFSYDDGSGSGVVSASEKGFLRPQALLSSARDVSGVNQLVEYTVKKGDSFEAIADAFGVSVDSVLWANNFASDTVIHPSQHILVPPVTGLVYTVVALDTLGSIASKFGVEAEKISTQNRLVAGSELKVGQVLVIPGARPVRAQPAPLLVQNTTPKQVKTASLAVAKKVATPAPKKATKPTGQASQSAYDIGWTGKGKSFAWGNCTYFVANYKNVTWRGNANQWLRNAKKAGVATGSKPVAGAIISFSGGGYNPWYGHVGIVMEVHDDYLIIKDMNYRRLNEVTVRKVNRDDGAINGYIYTD